MSCQPVEIMQELCIPSILAWIEDRRSSGGRAEGLLATLKELENGIKWHVGCTWSNGRASAIIHRVGDVKYGCGDPDAIDPARNSLANYPSHGTEKVKV